MNKITMKGNELNLIGEMPQLESKIIDFTLVSNNLTPKGNKEYLGKVLVLVTVPSLDTGVCDMEVRKFNTEVSKLSKDIHILAISNDLPFAQKRWCAAAGIENVETLSDHLTADFGKNYGILIKELRLLARAIFVYDKAGKLVYKEIVKELTNEPDYNKALEAARKVL